MRPPDNDFIGPTPGDSIIFILILITMVAGGVAPLYFLMPPHFISWPEYKYQDFDEQFTVKEKYYGTSGVILSYDDRLYRTSDEVFPKILINHSYFANITSRVVSLGDRSDEPTYTIKGYSEV